MPPARSSGPRSPVASVSRVAWEGWCSRMQFKDASEVHKFAVKMDRPDLFDEVVGAAIDQALGQLDLVDRNPQGKEGSSDQIKNCLPTFTIKDLKEQVDSTNAGEWYCPLFLKRGEINLFGGESKKSGKTTFYMH